MIPAGNALDIFKGILSAPNSPECFRKNRNNYIWLGHVCFCNQRSGAMSCLAYTFSLSACHIQISRMISAFQMIQIILLMKGAQND